MGRVQRIAGVGVAVLALLVAATGCGAGDGGDGGDDAGFSVAESVAQLPALEGGPLVVTVADLAAVSEANRLERPDDPEAATPDWLMTVSGASEAAAMVVPPVYTQSTTPAEAAEVTGFWWGASDTFAAVSAGPDELAVFEGDLGEPEAGDDGLRVATDDGRIAVSRSDDLLQDWLDGDLTTLEDDERLTAVAEGLDESGAISAVLFTLDDSAPTIGIGWAGEHDGDALAAVVYGFASEDAATEAKTEIETGFAEVDDLMEVDEVVTSGSTVTVTVRLAPDQVRAPYEQMVGTMALPVPR